MQIVERRTHDGAADRAIVDCPVEPCECLIELTESRVHYRNLKRTGSGALLPRDQIGKNAVPVKP